MASDPATGPRRNSLFGSWLGFVLAAAGAVVALWFLQKIVIAILLLFFGSIVLLGWLVIPQLAAQIVTLVNQLPDFIARIDRQFADLLTRYPDLHDYFSGGGSPVRNIAPEAGAVFQGISDVSLGLLGGIALAILFFSTVAYVLLDPKPILRAYLGSLPVAYQRPGLRAYRRACRAVIGWTKASLVIGGIQAVAVFIFLSIMDVPGALVWAALAFFADFIPRIGGYVMALPPVILSLTIGPMTAVWVALYYIVSNEILGSVVAPKIRGATMQLHPVLILFFTLAFALAFGLLGAIVATPAAAFFSAYYSEFYLKRPLRRETRT